MIRRPPRSTLFPLHDALPICRGTEAARQLRHGDDGFTHREPPCDCTEARRIVVSLPGGESFAPANGPRVSCGALKKDSFPSLRPLPNVSASWAARKLGTALEVLIG